MHSTNIATSTAATITAAATAATTTAGSAIPLRHHASEQHSPRRWAVALAVLALLLLALLSLTGAAFEQQLMAAAEAAHAQAAGSLADLDGVLAGIRWVR